MPGETIESALVRASTTGNNVAAIVVSAAAQQEFNLLVAGNVMSIVDITRGSH